MINFLIVLTLFFGHSILFSADAKRNNLAAEIKTLENEIQFCQICIEDVENKSGFYAQQAQALVKLALLAENKTHLATARILLSKAIVLEPNNSEYVVDSAQLNLLLGDKDAVRCDLQELEKLALPSNRIAQEYVTMMRNKIMKDLQTSATTIPNKEN